MGRIVVAEMVDVGTLSGNSVMNSVAINGFTIDATNNIAAFASLEEARIAKINNADYFGTTQELANLAASWCERCPVELWNSFAGVAPFTSLKLVKQFPTRKAALADIWKVSKLCRHALRSRGPRRAHLFMNPTK